MNIDNFRYITQRWERYLSERDPHDYLTIYIHIPFCLSKCRYCMYRSRILLNPSQIDEYLSSLEKEIQRFSPLFRGEKISSVYIGGGTPSIMSIAQTQRLFNFLDAQFDLDVRDENMFSFECNPNNLNHDKIGFLADSFINRISLGVQTFNEGVLNEEGRKSPSKDTIASLITLFIESFAHKHSRINVDLMIGLQGQKVQMIEEDLNLLSDLRVPRITLYANRRKREEEEQKEFELYVFAAVRRLASLLPGYILHTSEHEFSEPNFFTLKDFKHPFERYYNTHPYFNNNIGFGHASHSFISGSEFYYMNLNGSYHITHDRDNGISSDETRLLFANARDLRQAHPDMSYVEY